MKTAIISAVIVVVVIGAYMLMRNNNGDALNPMTSPTLSPSQSSGPTASPSASVSPSPTPTASSVSNVKTFTVIGKPFAFAPAQITVNKGDTVKIVFKNESGQHDWRLDEFDAHTNVIQGGQEQTIQFVASKTGTFEYYCSVGNHRLLGMKGTLTVK